MPQNIRDRNQDEMVALHAIIGILPQVPTPKGRGEFLITRLGERPDLVKYFRSCYDYDRFWNFRPDWMTDVYRYQKHAKTDSPLPILAICQRIDKLPTLDDKERLWVSNMKGLSAMAQYAAERVLDRKLVPGMTGRFVNRVLIALGQEPIASYTDDEIPF
jgi:hypothetical protein